MTWRGREVGWTEIGKWSDSTLGKVGIRSRYGLWALRTVHITDWQFRPEKMRRGDGMHVQGLGLNSSAAWPMALGLTKEVRHKVSGLGWSGWDILG